MVRLKRKGRIAAGRSAAGKRPRARNHPGKTAGGGPRETEVKHMKKNRILSDFALISLFYVALGVILLGWPELSSRIICCAFGGVLALAGLLRAARYFLRDRYETMMRRDLSVGLILMAAGGFLILRMDAVISLLPFVFGLMLLGGCAGKLQTAVDLRRVGSGMWLASLLMAAVSLALGIVLLCQPFESAMVLTRFIGVAITLEGAENLAALPIFDRQIQDFYDRNDDIERR